MSANVAAAAAARVSQAASPAASQPPPSTFSALHNNTQPQAVHAVAASADMLPQSLTHPSSAIDSDAGRQQFFAAPLVQQRLTEACTSYSAAISALQKARDAREHFVNSACKGGGSKQLPKKLQWKLTEQLHFPTDSMPGDFFRSHQEKLRAIEREATEKAYEALLAAKDDHVAALLQRTNLAHFVAATSAEFSKTLTQMATEFNEQINTNPMAPSQSDFAFPTADVARYFHRELINRLNAQTLERVAAQAAEQQRLSAARAEDSKAQELVLAGAHTGQTISMLAQKQIQQSLIPMQRQIAELQKQLQQQKQTESTTANTQPRHRAQQSDASPSSSAQAPHNRDKPYQHSRAVTVGKQITHKRARSNGDDEHAIERAPSHHPSYDASTDPNKRRKKLTITFASKNGAGGDRPPRSDQQRPHSSRPANAQNHQHARHRGRGPRSDEQQQQQQKHPQ
jgi:hypothetical protein